MASMDVGEEVESGFSDNEEKSPRLGANTDDVARLDKIAKATEYVHELIYLAS